MNALLEYFGIYKLLAVLSCTVSKIFAGPVSENGLSVFYRASNVVIKGSEAGFGSSVIIKPSSILLFNGSTATTTKMERPNGASFMACPDLGAETGHVSARLFR